MNFEKAFPYPTDCTHPASEVRRKTATNGAIMVGRQCTSCGSVVGPWLKKTRENANAPAWDEHLQDAWWERAKLVIEGKRAEADQERSAEHRAWLLEHDAYLRTPEWADLRAKVIRREKGLCQGCMEVRGTEVHHMTYVRWKRELLTDLVLYCRSCHERYHATSKVASSERA